MTAEEYQRQLAKAKKYQAARRSKYGETRASLGGKVYDSTRERNDAVFLRDLLRRGVIQDLKEQVRYRVYHKGSDVCSLIVDFQFMVAARPGATVWYETKGFPSPVWQLKAKLIRADLEAPHRYLVNANEKEICSDERFITKL